MSRRDDRSSNSGSRRNESRRNEGYRYQEVDPEYDARTYTSADSRNVAPVTQSGVSSSSRPQRASLVNYDYASDDSPVVSSMQQKKDKRRSRSRSPAISKKEKRESKKSKKKKKSRSNSRDRENSSSKRHKSKKHSASPLPIQSPETDDIKIIPTPDVVSRRKASPPRQYAHGPSSVKEPAASPPKAYQFNKGRKDSELESRMQRSRDRSPTYRRSSKSPTSPFG